MMIIVHMSIIITVTLVFRRLTAGEEGQEEEDEEEERQSFYVRLREKPLAKNDSAQYEHLHVVGRRRRVARTNKGGTTNEQAMRHMTMHQSKDLWGCVKFMKLLKSMK